MAKSSRRRRAKRRQSRQQKRKRVLTLKAESGPVSQADQATSAKVKVPYDDAGWDESPRTFAVRAVGIAPIALLVASLASHPLYEGSVPSWFQPVVEKQTAVLTLSAGHAGIIGLLISTKGRLGWSTGTLLIAALATATAGFRTIGDSTTGQIVAFVLLILTIPAVWPEQLITKLLQYWRLLWSRKVLSILLFVIGVVGIAYNQSRDENYIRDWMIIFPAVVTGIFLVSYLVWLLMKSATKCISVLCDLFGSLVMSARGRVMWRRSDSK